MQPKWFLAKYIPDMRRREPINVGVVLVHGERRLWRFIGQRADGSIDGRRLRWAGSSENYKAWCAYWTHQLERSADVVPLLASPSDSSYFIEAAGERLLGGSMDVDTEGLLDDLYTTLVESNADRDTLSVARLSETVLARVGIREHVVPKFRYRVSADDVDDEIVFDYRYDNGAINLMQRVQLAYVDDRAWEAAHAAVWAFKTSAEHPLEAAGAQRQQRCIALVKTRSEDPQLSRQLALLDRHAEVVDVTEEERATLRLRSLLHL